jgi:hypothetical protein
MPEPGDAFARLLRDVDGPASPRPEFAEALLDRLLVELTGNSEDIASSPPPPPTRPPTPPSSFRRQNDGRRSVPARRARRFPNALATAALVLLTLVASFFAFGPGRPERQHHPVALVTAFSGTPMTAETEITETLLDATTDALPTGHALIEVHRWRLQPSSTPLTLWSQEGVVMIVVESGAITATAAGTEHGLAAGETFAPNTQDVALRAAESKDATAFVVYLISGWANPGLLERGQAIGDSLAHAEERLITASAEGFLGGPARLVLERQILSPGSSLPPQQVRPGAWVGIGEGTLGLIPQGERLPFGWKPGTERRFRSGESLPITQPGTTMTLRNAGDSPLVLYRLTLTPSGAAGSATGTPVP